MRRSDRAAQACGWQAGVLPVTATSPMFRPVTTQNAFELVVDQVRTAVDLALLVPGDRLPPERELTALLEWRRLVEAEAAALAATRVSDDQLRALRARLVESGSRQVPPGPERWRAADSRFHMAVAEASDNPYILHAVHRVRAELAHALDALILLQAAAGPAAAVEHEAILAALQERDPDAARAAADRHGHSTERRLAAFLGNL